MALHDQGWNPLLCPICGSLIIRHCLVRHDLGSGWRLLGVEPKGMLWL